MKHFIACNIQFLECRRLTLFSCVMTILTFWKGLCGYDRDMSCQDFCTVCLLRTFPSHYSICKQHVIPAVQHIHFVFSCFLIFLWWLFVPAAKPLVTQCVGLNSWWQFFAIFLIFWSNHQHLTHIEPSIPLCVCHASENSPNLPQILNW